MFIPARGNCLAASRRDPLHLCHPLLTCYLLCLRLCLCVSGCNKLIANIIPGPGQLSSCCCNPVHLCLPLLAQCAMHTHVCLLLPVGLPLQFIQSEDRRQCNEPIPKKLYLPGAIVNGQTPCDLSHPLALVSRSNLLGCLRCLTRAGLQLIQSKDRAAMQ